jgi:hypothetical protein
MDNQTRRRRQGPRRPVRRNPQQGNNMLTKGIPHPPPIQPQITHRQRMRFTVTTAQTRAQYSFQYLLDLINVATSATVAYDLFDAVRVNAVEVWAAPVQGAAPQQVALEFAGITVGASGDGRLFSDSSMGIEPAHVRGVPSKLSQAAQWQPTSSWTAFTLTAPVASVIDVDLSFRTVQSAVPVAVLSAPVGATAGQLYYRGLDGNAAAGTQVPAVTPGPTD